MFYPILNEYYQADLKVVDLFLATIWCTGNVQNVSLNYDRSRSFTGEAERGKRLGSKYKRLKEVGLTASLCSNLAGADSVCAITLSATEVWKGG